MKIAFLTLGCKVNQYEADELARILRKRGHQVLTELGPADCFILSTCAVTNEAERKSRQMIAKLEKISPNAKIIVCGCASQNDAKKFIDKPNVTVVVGTAGKNWIPDLLEEKGNYVVDPAFDYEDFEENTESSTNDKLKRTRAYVKVQDGCNNYCSYCLIPYLRGRSRSRDLESIVVEVYRLAKFHHEVVLTGINLSDWGSDIEMNLVDLLSSLSTINARIRLSSFEANVITPELIKAMTNMPNFCEHFHLSMQSACDKTLKNVEEIGFADMHIFPYSKREGTVASGMKQVDGEVVKERVVRLTTLRNKMKQEFLQKEYGMIYEVLLEQEKDGYIVGHARNFTKVYIPKGVAKPNELVMARMGKPYLDGVLGEFVKICED